MSKKKKKILDKILDSILPNYNQLPEEEKQKSTPIVTNYYYKEK
ncbi:hypothetical protein [Clostridium grantii]|uniref:Uncharacterized protein n=1 Tax=Clostridium grantii DSM 8605 TaxID=1121316 RepID=A0A1M5QPA6_9CLOT|nr:hypothetical protein [Clostridium grantii]SHH15393.1 hypothetical protein SAMN02745207_00193 [Clostridium grantii DSM 8605]